MAIRFALCAPAERAMAATLARYDLIEPAANDLATKRHLLNGAECASTNLFFPGGIRVLLEPDRAFEIGKSIIQEASSLGVRTMVVGSGGQRRAAPELTPEEGLSRFCDLMARLQEVATPLGIVLAPETLRRQETDVANSLAPLVAGLGKVGVAYTADVYHIWSDYEATGLKVSWADWLDTEMQACPHHVHFCSPERDSPRTDDPRLATFVKRLKKLNFDGIVAFEGQTDDAAITLLAMKEVWGGTPAS